MITDSEILTKIKSLGKTILPEGSRLYLYGSRARGDNRPDSDWDLLVLLNKKHEPDDFDKYSYPFIELGFDLDIRISARDYSLEQWSSIWFTPFYHNVENDKKVLI